MNLAAIAARADFDFFRHVHMLAAISEAPARKRLGEELVTFAEAVPAHIHVDAEGVIFHFRRAAPQAEMERLFGERVELGDFLGEAERLVPRRHQHAGAECEIGKARGDEREEPQWVGRWIIIGEVMLDHPCRAETQFLAKFAVGENFVIGFAVGEAGFAGRRRDEAEFDVGLVVHLRFSPASIIF